MIYVVLIPISLYVALAALALSRRPRSILNPVLALYAIMAALASSAYLVLGTTTAPESARIAGLIAVLSSGVAYMVLLPLVLLGLYFEAWLAIHRRGVLIAAAASSALVAGAVLVWQHVSALPLVTQIGAHDWIHWILAETYRLPPQAIAVMLASQVPGVLVIAVALRQRRLPPWRGALPLTLVNVSSVLLPLLAPLAGASWIVVLTALGYVPPVTLYAAMLLLRATRQSALEARIGDALPRHHDGLAVLDASHRVVWYNADFARWLPRASSNITPQPVHELLHGTLLQAPLQALLASPDTQTECAWTENGAAIVLRLDLHPLDRVRDVPGAQLLAIRDITTNRDVPSPHAQRAELLALSAISADIASSLDTEQVITRALQQTQAVVEADSAVIYLLDRDDPTRLVRRGQIVRDRQREATPEAPAELPLEGTTAGWIVQHVESVIMPRILPDDDPGMAAALPGMQAGAAVPLLARNRVIGVLQLGMRQPRNFDPVTIALIESVGQQLGVAIDNARLYDAERRQRHVAEVLGGIARILTSRDSGETLHALLEQLQHLIAYERASILLLTEQGTLSVAAHAGFGGRPGNDALAAMRIVINDYPHLQRLFAERQPQLVPDTACDPGWKPGPHPLGSWIGAPLVLHDQVLGCLSIGHSTPDYFTGEHMQLVAMFADQAVVAVENARLFEAEQRRLHNAEFLYHASHDLINSADLDDALYTALTHLVNILPFDQARIGLLDDTQSVWNIRVSYPADCPPQRGKALHTDDYPLVARLVQTCETVYVPDTRDEPLWTPDPPGEREIRTWIGVPLVAHDRLIGLLSLYSFVPHRFTPEQVGTVRLFANLAAAVLENFRLLDEASRRNQTLSALNTVLAASNEALAARDDVLQVSLARVLDVLDLPGGAIHQLDESRKWLHLRAAVGLPDDIRARLDRVPAGGNTGALSLPAIQAGDRDGQALAFVSVPLTASGQTIGLLSILGAAAQPENDNLRALLASIGQQLGVVMDNAILFEATTRRAALSTDLNRLSLAISAQLDRDTVLKLLCDESLGVFDAHGAYIWLAEDDALTGAAASGPGAEDFSNQRIALDDPHALPARVLEEWRPLYAHHLSAGSRALPESFMAATGARSALAIPLLKADIPLGVLMLVNAESPDGFASWPLDQISVLGVQAALAIQNATLFDELRRRLDQLRLVNEASRYATALLSPKPLLEGVTRKIAQSLNYELVSLLEVAPGATVIHTALYQDAPLPDAHIEPLRDTLLQQAGRAVQQAAPVQDNAVYQLPDPSGGERSAVHLCMLAVPMIIADEVTGVLMVARRASGSITGEDMDVLQPLAAQLAISLSNARLYERVRQQTAALEARVARRTAEIRREQERTEAILRSVADAVIVVDLNAQVVLTNPVARTLFDKHDLDMDLGARVRELVAPMLNAEHDLHDDPTEILETGSVTLQAKAAPVVEDDQVLGAVVLLRDITRLRELDRMKDMFVSNVSHELRTPIANLKLYLSLLEQGPSERRARYHEVMQREVDRLERLISDLLQISRLKNERAERAAAHEPVQVDEVIDSVIEGNLALAHSQNIILRHERQVAPMPRSYGNPDQIFRAINNLVSNALRYTPEGGRVTVRSRSVDAPGQTRPEWVIIEVVDTGIGIPKREVPAIFERFYRGSNVSPTISGTGLGLAIVKEIVDLHGGMLDVQSEEGRGSTFRIALPVYDDT